MRLSTMLKKQSCIALGFLLILLNIQNHAAYAGEVAQTHSFFNRFKTVAYAFGLAHGASMLSKYCALWGSHEVLGLQPSGVMYTAVMLDWKHINNAIARTLFAQEVGSENSLMQMLIRKILFISKITKEDGVTISGKYAPNAVMPALYKEFNGKDFTEQQKTDLGLLLTPNEQLSLEWYNTGTGFLTFWECLGLLSDAWEEITKKWELSQKENQNQQEVVSKDEHNLVKAISLEGCPNDVEKLEQKPSQFERYMSAAYQDWDILTWGVTLFAVSYIGNMAGQKVGQSATRLLKNNGVSIFENSSVLSKYAPFFKYSDTVISYFIAQFIKHHVFNGVKTVQDYFGGYESEYFRFWDLMYRAADKGPFAWYFVLNFMKACSVFKQQAVIGKSA